MRTVDEMIIQEKQSDSVARRFAAFVLDEAFDMDWICEDADVLDFAGLVEEIEKCEVLMAFAERIVWGWE